MKKEITCFSQLICHAGVSKLSFLSQTFLGDKTLPKQHINTCEVYAFLVISVQVRFIYLSLEYIGNTQVFL